MFTGIGKVLRVRKGDSLNYEMMRLFTSLQFVSSEDPETQALSERPKAEYKFEVHEI